MGVVRSSMCKDTLISVGEGPATNNCLYRDDMYVLVITYSRVLINYVRLLILLMVS